MKLRKELLIIFGLIATSPVFATQIFVQGKIDSVDCGHIVVEPSQASQKSLCVVSFSGTSKLSHTTLTYEGEISLMSPAQKPLELVGKKGILTLDLERGEIYDWVPDPSK